MSDVDSRTAWADFWAAPQGGGCLAGADAEFEGIEAAIWRPLVNGLVRKGKVLDIGTGDGIVLKRLAKLRPDLKLTGIDSSPQLPPSPRGITLRPGIEAEHMPFGDRTFDAIVSRYGYEYARTADVAREVARVVGPGGKLLLIVHHKSSPVVAWNERRAAALAWAASTSGYIDKARAYASARAVTRLPVPPALAVSVRDAAARFPADPVAAEVLTAMLQSLDPRLQPAQSLAALESLARKASGELARLHALAGAAKDQRGVDLLSAELTAAGFEMERALAVNNRSGQPMAWLLSGSRLADQ